MNLLLEKRLKSRQDGSKMSTMAKQSLSGERTTFSGMFPTPELHEQDRERMEALLEEYAIDKTTVDKDLSLLLTVTAEVRAIEAQSIILHGERIQKAHDLLLHYREGAFTAWLYATYGNRQTPYNFFQYYLFYQNAPLPLKPLIEAMPRQAIYSLASRQGEFSQKMEIVKKYQGETKQQLLEQIREQFPLQASDRRRTDLGERVLKQLTSLLALLRREKGKIKKREKEKIAEMMDAIDEEIFGPA